MQVGMGIVIHICNPSTWEAEAGGLWTQCHPRLCRETLSQNYGLVGRERELLYCTFRYLHFRGGWRSLWPLTTTKQKCILLAVLESRSPKARCHRAVLPARALGKSHFSFLPALVAPGSPWLVATSPYLCIHHHVTFFPLSLLFLQGHGHWI
jgi:hypothetical protein